MRRETPGQHPATGVNHVVAAVTDPYLVKAFTEREIANCPDTRGQLQLIRDRVMPALESTVGVVAV